MSASEPEQAGPVQSERRMSITGCACDIISAKGRVKWLGKHMPSSLEQMLVQTFDELFEEIENN